MVGCEWGVGGERLDGGRKGGRLNGWVGQWVGVTIRGVCGSHVVAQGIAGMIAGETNMEFVLTFY